MSLVRDVLRSIEGDAPVRDLRVCLRATAVWSRRLGLAYTFPRTERSAGPRRRLSAMSARELAELALSDDLVEASVGFAAAASLLDPSRLELAPQNAHELIVERARGGEVTVVGHFPFVEWLGERTRNLWVLELAPRAGDLPATEAAAVLPRSDVVAITGTALLNHTIEPLLELARDAFTIVVGPSTPLSPALFDHGVDAICGAVAEEPEAALAHASEGGGFRHMAGLRRVTALKRREGR